MPREKRLFTEGHREMKSKAVSGTMLTLLSIGMLILTFKIQPVKASAVVSPYIAVVPESTVDPALTPGMNYTISIYTDYNGNDINSYGFELTYNPNVLEGIEVVNGDLIADDTMFHTVGFNNTAGRLRYTNNFLFFLNEPAPLTSGPGTLANVTFRVVAKGTSNITLEDQGMHGGHAYRTRLIGYTGGGYGTFYNIIDSATMPDHIQHGFFDNQAYMPPPVGGKATPINIPMDKPETPTLWIWLTTITLSLVVTVVYVKKRKRHTEINS